jgi:hypothetical protein
LTEVASIAAAVADIPCMQGVLVVLEQGGGEPVHEMAEHAEQDKGQEAVEQLVDKHRVEGVSTQAVNNIDKESTVKSTKSNERETVWSHEVRLLQTQCEAVCDDFLSDPRPVELPAQY